MQDFIEIREKGNLTSALIIIELLKGKRKLREISADLDISPQGASNYLKNLQKTGYVDPNNIPTQTGIAFLQQILETTSLFVENAYEDTGIISSCEAIAAEHLRKNERVSLMMDKGLLYAHRGSNSNSTGIADFDATEGSPVRISKIEGIISHKVGNFFVVSVDFDDYASHKFDKMKRIVKERKVEYVGAYGTLASKFCKDAGVSATIYAPVEGCIEAGVKGINSMLIYSTEMTRFFFQKLSANIDKYRINPKFVEL